MIDWIEMNARAKSGMQLNLWPSVEKKICWPNGREDGKI